MNRRKRMRDSTFESQLCPECDEPISADDVNLKEGVALCPGCGKLFRLSELNLGGRPSQEILQEAPSGCDVSHDGDEVVVTASLRSLPTFLVTLFACLFWNGIVSVFLLVAIAGLWFNFIGPLPAWFPAPGSKDGVPIMNDDTMGLGMTLFLCVFLTPFVVIGTILIGVTLLSLAGRVQVVLQREKSYAATGIAFMRFTKRFDPNQVQSVDLGITRWQSEGEHRPLIEIKSDRIIKFGSMLSTERMEWMRAVLAVLLLNKNSPIAPAYLPRLSWIHNAG